MSRWSLKDIRWEKYGMDEFTAEAFANREDSVPLLTVTYDDVDPSSSEPDTSTKRSRLRKSLSATRLKEKAQSLHNEKIQASTTERLSLQDRLFTKLLSQVIPTEDYESPEEEHVDRRSSKYVKRPDFSLPVMTNNFRRFNARIGIVFVFQNRMIRLFSWRTTTHTLSFLAAYTFVCLDPYLLVALPLAIALLFIMVPAFISRHPPPPAFTSTSPHFKYDPISAYSYSGPALAPPRTIKPAAETSKDFFRNMRDLQNSMSDFSNLHDTLVTAIAPATNFSNEVLSSTIFLYLAVVTTVLFIAAHLIPFRLILLFSGYALTISGHPQVQIWLIKQQKRAERKMASETQIEIYGLNLPTNAATLKLKSAVSSLSQITLSTAPETREVEIFELQHRPILPSYQSPATSQLHPEAFEWQPHLFTPSPHDPLSPSRIAGDRPRGTRFFEDVRAPDGWEWVGKKWELDLEAGEWVNERLIVGVEYDALHKEDTDKDDEVDSDDNNDRLENFEQKVKRQQSINLDFGGWVWDLPPAVGTSGNRDEDVWLAYGDYDLPNLGNEKERKKAKKQEEKKGSKKSNKETGKAWEEGVRFGNKGRTGEWRRRRWVRVVRRISVEGDRGGGR